MQEQRTIQNYSQDRPIKNEGYLDEQKHIKNTRILHINTNGFGPNQTEKIDQMINYYTKHQISIVLHAETNIK